MRPPKSQKMDILRLIFENFSQLRDNIFTQHNEIGIAINISVKKMAQIDQFFVCQNFIYFDLSLCRVDGIRFGTIRCGKAISNNRNTSGILFVSKYLETMKVLSAVVSCGIICKVLSKNILKLYLLNHFIAAWACQIRSILK